jgi:hypothetical protein
VRGLLDFQVLGTQPEEVSHHTLIAICDNRMTLPLAPFARPQGVALRSDAKVFERKAAFARIERAAAARKRPPEKQEQEAKKGNGSGFGGGHDPLIIGLFQKLPPPEADWPVAGRVKWLQTAANIFDLLYKRDGGGIAITTARADRSPRPHDE